MRLRLTEGQREQAVWAIQNEMADANKTLPHEELWSAIGSLDSFLEDENRDANRPRMKMLLSAVLGESALREIAALSVEEK